MSKDEDEKGKEIVSEGKDKEKITPSNDADLEEEIVIPNQDLANLSAKHIDILGELQKKRARQQKLQAKKKRKQVLTNIKEIFIK